MHPNGSLSVRAVTERDVGDYLCIARNKVADDYRVLRVSVVTKPAKIEPKQPLNQMVSFGKPLKVSYTKKKETTVFASSQIILNNIYDLFYDNY